MAKLCEQDPLSGQIDHSILSRSPSPTLIYPLPPACPLENGDWSQNSLGTLDSTLPHSHSQSPETNPRQRERRSLKEISHLCRSVESTATALSTPGRSTVVTDIDKAMAHMDEVYLKTLFNNTVNKTETYSATTDATYSSFFNNDALEETNIDDEPSGTMIMAVLQQK
ncbi:unnamed protein product [Candidula unifasciata]|uniref:Uncharacterized protein n=1 Tax=Candidula unifasciata TaxID=100452 RepID=A0A8S3ZWD8_9EUPU|nr:unnamed protein product [Candidula unifasciata]